MEGALGCHQQGRRHSLSEAKAGSPGPLQQEGGESPFLQGPPQSCPLDPRQTLRGLGARDSPHRSGEAREEQRTGESSPPAPESVGTTVGASAQSEEGSGPIAVSQESAGWARDCPEVPICGLSHHHH